MDNKFYDDNFYKNRNRNSEYAARTILKIVFDETGISPDSIVDIGCGVGTWLNEAQKYKGGA